ncbi:MAG: hypothetical protein IKW30_04195 [Lachnospiraceae bacterium]|nr:hypothetical protein [Lachnospiraceae bacterium]
MKINFDWQSIMSKNETTKTSQIIDEVPFKEKNKIGTGFIHKQTIVDISDKVTDDFTYLDQGGVAEKLNGMIGSEDYLGVQRDFMTVMSHSMSASDFQKMKEDGYSLNQMEPEQIVTILDKIKTVLAQSGTHIEGYNDNLSVDKITEITGNSGYAETIAKELSYANAPVTEENMKAIDKVVDQALIMKEPKEDNLVYMVGQKMSPTLGNFYKAAHSSGMRNTPIRKTGYASTAYSKQGIDALSVRKTNVTEKDYLQMEKQIKQRMKADGLEVSSKNMEAGKWLLEKGLPVTGENIELLQQLKNVVFPLDVLQTIRQSAIGIAEGKSPFDVNLNQTDEGVYKEAVKLYHRYQKITFQAVDDTVNKGKECTLKNMEEYDSKTSHNIPQLQARKTLEEVRLKMTVEANVKLLQSGYSIETAPMEDFIKQLEKATQELDKNLWGSNEANTKSELFKETTNYLQQLPKLPISIVGKIPFMEKATISTVVQEGETLRQGYEQARATYETIMTAPRADLGDSIKKAFRNVDDILKDMDLEVNEANQRAIRIMGYNQITITEENLSKIKEADKQVRTIIAGMKPGMVLSMIRQGKNPLEMSIEEVRDYILEREKDFLSDSGKFSSFLYKLDKKKEITEEEREAYIGIYRMLRQIEKSDGAVIGSLLEQNAEINFSNLLSAVRTRKAKHTDVRVDDSIGGITEVYRKEKSISDQIKKGYQQAHKILEGSSLNLKLDDVLKEVKELQLEENLEKEFAKEQMQEIREQAKLFIKEKDFLEEYHQPVNLDTLQSAYNLRHKRGNTFKKVMELENKLSNVQREALEEGILKKAEKFLENMEKENKPEAVYDDMISYTKEMLQESLNRESKYLNLKELQSLYKQLSFASDLAKEENYEIPIQIGEEITSVNLKVVHRNSEKREVRITMDTEDFGKIDARFVETDDGLEGSVLTDYMDGKKRLEGHSNRLQEALKEALQETKLEVKSIFFGINEKMDINSLQHISNNKKTDITLLYKVAKEFISYVKDIKET